MQERAAVSGLRESQQDEQSEQAESLEGDQLHVRPQRLERRLMAGDPCPSRDVCRSSK